MKFDNLLRYAVRILDAYSGDIPLNNWLRSFFRENPQMGSRDRKQVSEMVYCFFRLGHALKNISPEERILIGIFLSNQKKEQILEHLRPEWHAQIEMPLAEKLKIIRTVFPTFIVTEIFPWKDFLSRDVDHYLFCLSFLEKPRLFVRIRPGYEKSVTSKLRKQDIEFQNADAESELPFVTYSFAGTTKLDEIILINREAVVQDLSSQYTARYLKSGSDLVSEAWDCCSGSGGKSILMHDLYPACRLTVSDIRDSILKNLSIRFQEAGIKSAFIFKSDLTDQNDLPRQSFPFIIADLPCTGSGTWSRNPEALYYFKPASISNYRQRQEKIISNIIHQLQPNGILVYITCSVFAEENEVISALMETSNGLKLVHQNVIKGYGRSADSMFAARFIKV